jgi:predicted dehydrogenase
MKHLNEVGAAVIGGGFIGTVHVETLRRLGVTVCGVLEVSPERGAERAAALELPQAYPSLEALLADDRVDVVHVTSPNDLHYAQVRAIVASGRHVICEKPLALTSAQASEMVRLAEQGNLVNAVNFNIRFYPLNQHLHEVVRDGELGEIRLITGRYFQDWLLYDTDWNWRVLPEQSGMLRALGDIGSHWIDLATFLSGQHITAVMADFATFIPVRYQPSGIVETFDGRHQGAAVPHEVRNDDVASLLLKFANGARGALSVSQISAGRKNSLTYEIDGASTSAAWDSECPDSLWIGHRDRPNEVLQRNPALMGPLARAASILPGGHVEGFADTFRALFKAVYEDVASGRPVERPSYPTFADGLDELRVVEAALRSAREGRWVQVERAATVAQEVPKQ